MIRNMSVENLAKILVKPCVVNMEDLYYVTTTGQLYQFNEEGFNGAVRLQTQYLNTPVQNSQGSVPDPNARKAPVENLENEQSDQLTFDDITKENKNVNNKN